MMVKLRITFPLANILEAVEQLQTSLDSADLLGYDAETVEALRGGVLHLRSLVRDIIRSGHISEAEYDEAVELARSAHRQEWVDAGGLTAV